MPRRIPDSSAAFPPLPHGLRIIHLDRDLAIVEKPPGVPSTAPKKRRKPGSQPRDAESIVRRALTTGGRGRVGPGGQARALHLLQRIERDIGGLLVFATNKSAFESLREQLMTGRFHRFASAVIRLRPEDLTPPEPDEGAESDSPTAAPWSARYHGTIRTPLVEHPDGRVEALPPEAYAGHELAESGGPVAKPGVTHFTVQETGQGFALLRLRLETARRGQIAAHLRSIGRPVVGDSHAVQGDPPADELPATEQPGPDEQPSAHPMIHLREIGFAHPWTKKPVRYSVPVPPAFRDMLNPPDPDQPAQQPADPPEHESAAPSQTTPTQSEPSDEPAAPDESSTDDGPGPTDPGTDPDGPPTTPAPDRSSPPTPPDPDPSEPPRRD